MDSVYIQLPLVAHVRTMFLIQYTRISAPRSQYALTWKIMVSEWRSVIAVSLNIGGGVWFIRPAKLYKCTQKHYRHNVEGGTVPSVCGVCSVPPRHLGMLL